MVSGDIPNVVLHELWAAVKGKSARTGVPFNPDLGLVKFWSQDPLKYGSALSREIKHPNDPDIVFQVFTRAILRWHSGTGGSVVASDA